MAWHGTPNECYLFVCLSHLVVMIIMGGCFVSHVCFFRRPPPNAVKPFFFCNWNSSGLSWIRCWLSTNNGYRHGPTTPGRYYCMYCTVAVPRFVSMQRFQHVVFSNVHFDAMAPNYTFVWREHLFWMAFLLLKQC